MNNSGINYLINKNLLNDTGNFKIFYDFNSYSQVGSDCFVNSVQSGNPIYTGQIFYFNQDINTNQFVNLTTDSSRDEHVTKTGELNFLGHRISSTGFGNSYLKILNSNNLYNGSQFTFIFEGGKISRNEAKSIYAYSGFDQIQPIHNKEIIFSNITGSGINYSGWEIGINGANLLYFRTSDNSAEKILTFDKSIPSTENIWGISYNEKNINILKFNPEFETVEFNSISLISNLKNGQDWYLGSGSNAYIDIYDTGMANKNTSSFKLKKFLYFSEFISENKFLDISKAIKSNLQQSITTLYTITGYEPSGYPIYYERTGIIAFESVLSGYITTGVTISGNPIYTPLSGEIIVCDNNSGSIGDFQNTGQDGSFNQFQTGELVSGNSTFSITCTDYNITYNPGYGNLLLENNILNTGGAITPLFFNSNSINMLSCSTVTIITGYDISYDVSGYNIQIPIYIQSGITGIIDSGTYTGYTGISTQYLIQETGFIITGEDYSNLYYKSASYIGQRNELDFIEINSGNLVYKNDTKIFNVNLNKSWSNYKNGYTVYINTGNYPTGKNRVYLNGLAIRNGTASTSRVVENGSEIFEFTFNKDYFITGNQLVIDELLFTGASQIENLYVILDLNEGNYSSQEILISNLDQYYSGTFSAISPSGKDIFFNGVKIYENENYYNINNQFAPIGYVTEVTGLYLAWPKISGTTYSTGSNIYDFYFTGSGFMKKDSNAVWINGVRKNPLEFIYHDIGVDLITGVYTSLEQGEFVTDGYMDI